MKRIVLPATLALLGAASVWVATPVRGQQRPEEPIPGPGPHEERHYLPEPATKPAVPSAPAAFSPPIIHFASGKSDLNPEARAALIGVASFLKTNPQATLTVEGHTDAVGSDVSNVRLSQARAAAVRSFLVQQGIEAHRIQTAGRGETAPVADNSSEGGRAMNRRADLRVSGATSAFAPGGAGISGEGISGRIVASPEGMSFRHPSGLS